jgi:hypothetical protein
MRTNWFPGLVALLALSAALPASAQSPAQTKSIFRQVIPNPTGQNGYEELVLAGERLQASKLYAQGKDKWTELSLEEKRLVLADKPVVDALRLVRQGLAKPVMSPRTDLSFETMLPELATFRDLAKVLAMQQYLQLADGRTGDAINTARVCLYLGQVVQTDTLISGLVGVAIGTIGIKALGAHLDQLSARDCEQLYRVTLEALSAPDPQPRLLAIEHAITRKTLQECLAKVKMTGASGIKTILGLDDASAAAADSYLRTLPPAELDRLGEEMLARLDQNEQLRQDELRKPPQQRQRLDGQFASDGSIAAKFVEGFLPSVDRVSERYTQDQAHLRMLACHCAILRYRWEHDELPATLDELRLGQLMLDPFTGQPLEYVVQGRRYTLTSVGPTATSDDPRAVGGRIPASIQEP